MGWLRNLFTEPAPDLTTDPTIVALRDTLEEHTKRMDRLRQIHWEGIHKVQHQVDELSRQLAALQASSGRGDGI